MKKDAPSGTALLLKQAMEQAGFDATDRRVVHPRRLSRHAHHWLRRSVRFHYADAYRPRPGRVRARRPDAAMGPGQAGLVHMHDVLGLT